MISDGSAVLAFPRATKIGCMATIAPSMEEEGEVTEGEEGGLSLP